VSGSPPENRRLPSRGAKGARVIDAPADPIPPGDESPPPAPTSTTVRPPRRPASRLSRLLQLAAGAIVVLAASIAVAWGARRYILTSPRFAIRTVVVDGARRRTAEQIAHAGGIEVGKNIFALDLGGAGAMMTQDPWVERATVTRKLPATIQVTVAEREAAAAVSIDGDLYLATRDGDLFKRLADGDPTDLAVVTGILPEQVARDRPGVVLAVKRVLDVAEDVERAGIARRYPIEELHLEKDGSLVLTIGREAVAVHLGQPPYRDKIAQAARVLNEIARRKASVSVIFLDNDAHPERVVVRMR
jgi:cell division protein FtsQ